MRILLALLILVTLLPVGSCRCSWPLIQQTPCHVARAAFSARYSNRLFVSGQKYCDRGLQTEVQIFYALIARPRKNELVFSIRYDAGRPHNFLIVMTRGAQSMPWRDILLAHHAGLHGSHDRLRKIAA